MLSIFDSNSAISSAMLLLSVNLYSTTSNPSFFAHSNCFAFEFSKSTPSAFTTLKILQYTILDFVMAGLSCLTEPEQRFLGFLYLAVASSIASLILLKSEYFIIASPLSINSPLNSIFRGIFWKFLALFVITSPIVPLPLVTASASSPSL